ncbi:Flp/Fap pilin component [Longilinea arvoryzae]|uniref:Flp/Fap pilin component n=1 Tax=Longilinea arvoryzae TaxID=360412 RepID=A0A0S7BJW1_9CHLR|nr:Flp/Fap pilin component [Longilinea arvoryzae]
MLFYVSEKGQGLVEYALIFVLVVVLAILLLVLFGSGVGNMYSNITNTV